MSFLQAGARQRPDFSCRGGRGHFLAVAVAGATFRLSRWQGPLFGCREDDQSLGQTRASAAHRILIPDLLEVQQPVFDFDHSTVLRFRVDYDFLPKSIIARFIVKMNRDIVGDCRWRTGVLLFDETYKSKAIVKADETERKIFIEVTGQHVRDYLTIIRATLREINTSFEKLDFSEKVPLPDDPQVAVSYQHLLHLEIEGIPECYPDGAKRPYKVSDLLGTLYVDGKYTEKEFIQLLQRVMRDTDTKEGALEKATQLLQLQPNFMGLGINLNELIARIFKKRKGKPV